MEDRTVRLRRYLATTMAIQALLLVLYVILFFTVFRRPTYVPFVSGGVSTLVPEGSYGAGADGAWERHRFDGKGDLEIRVRQIGGFELSEVVQQQKDVTSATDEVDLRDMVMQSLKDSAGAEGPAGATGPSDAGGPGVRGGPPQASAEETRRRIEDGRNYLQLLASNTPNLRFKEEIPAFDSTIFCLGSVGRGERRYRYLVHSGETVVDLQVHSRNSSHIVFKQVLDTALLNLQIGGRTADHLLEQAVSDISDQISPRWAQGNIFWLIFFIAVPLGIMLIVLPFEMMKDRRRGAAPEGPP
jgi:hypothetical protein